MDDGQRATVPGPASSVDVPGDVELVARGIDGAAVSAPRRAAVLLLIEGVQKSQDLFLPCAGVVLDDGRAVRIAAAVSTGDVVEVTTARIGVERGDVLLSPHGGGPQLFHRLGLYIEAVQ